MLPAALTLLLLGLTLYLLGRRGTTSSSFPFCARCRRNLYMLPPDTPRCPECGSDIRAPNATTLGLRQPARTPMILGLLITLAGTALLLLTLILWWPTLDASPLKPTSMLLAQLTNPSHTPHAARELQRRLHNNSLAPSDTTRLADLILKLQSDPAAPWNPLYGDVLQTAQSTRRLPADQWQTYLQNSIQLSARIRPRVTLGDPIPLQLTCRLKAGTQFAALLPAMLAPTLSLTLRDQTTLITLTHQPLDSIPTPHTWTTHYLPTATLAVGPKTLTLRAQLTLTDARTTTVTAAQTFSFPVEMLPPNQPSVTLVPPANETAERDFRAALHWRLRSPPTPDDTPPATATTPPAVLLDNSPSLGSLFISAPPIAACFRIVLRQDTNEWPLARVLVPPEDAATIPLTLPTTGPGLQPHPGPAELVCLPDPTPATATLELQQIYGSEIHHPVTLVAETPPTTQ